MLFNLVYKIEKKYYTNKINKRLYYGSNYVGDCCNQGLICIYNVFNLVYRHHFTEPYYGFNISGVSFSYNAESDSVYVMIESPRPGMIIGKSGCVIEAMERGMKEIIGKHVIIDIKEKTDWFNFFEF